jgi:putative endonuclease
MAKVERIAKRKPRPPADPERSVAFRFGLSAESRAAALLIAKGYRILFRRFKTPVGEIDIAAEAIGKRQQSRIIAAAEFWLAGHPADATSDMRFDVVLVAPGRLPVHLPAAFDAST